MFASGPVPGIIFYIHLVIDSLIVVVETSALMTVSNMALHTAVYSHIKHHMHVYIYFNNSDICVR